MGEVSVTSSPGGKGRTSYFLASHSLQSRRKGLHCTTPDGGEGGAGSQNTTTPPPAHLERLDLLKEDPPGLQVSLFLLDSIALPCSRVAQAAPTSTCSLPAAPPGAPPPQRWKGVSGQRPVNAHGGGGRVCVCVCVRACVYVCYRGQNTVLSGSQRVLSLGVRNGGQRKKIQAVFQQRQQQRRRRPGRASFVSRVSR